MPFTVLRVSKFDDQIEVTAEFEHQDEAEKFVEDSHGDGPGDDYECLVEVPPSELSGSGNSGAQMVPAEWAAHGSIVAAARLRSAAIGLTFHL